MIAWLVAMLIGMGVCMYMCMYVYMYVCACVYCVCPSLLIIFLLFNLFYFILSYLINTIQYRIL